MRDGPVQRRERDLVVALAAAGMLLLSMWIASQGGLTAVSGARFAVIILVILEGLFVLVPWWCGAAGWGFVLRRALVPEVPFAPVVQLGLGAAAQLMLAWGAGWAGLVSTAAAWAIVGVGVALLMVQLVLARHQLARPADEATSVPLPWTLLLAMPGLGLLLVAAACPPGTLWRVEAFGYDVLTYHLQLPREWLAAGAITGVEHNVYSYLPSLVEAGYTHLAAMQGSVYRAIYTCQLFHVSLAVLAAAAVTGVAARFTRPAAAVVAGAVLLSVPWVLITGSLAYNEMAVLAFGAVAGIVLFDVASERWGGASAIGLLAGAATLAKLTAGFMIAVPIGLVLLTRLNHAERWRTPPPWSRCIRAALIAGVVGLLTLTPYLVRNASWTGNPVFPFATSLLGTGHWDATLAQRWSTSHGLSFDSADHGMALARQWLFNAGYGAIGGLPTPRETLNIARFDREWGLPWLWLAVFLSAVVNWRQRGPNRAVWALLLIMGLQVAGWVLLTHLQSRFLVPTLLPAAVLVAMGANKLQQFTELRFRWAASALIVSFVLLLALASLMILLEQARFRSPSGEGRMAPCLIADSLADPDRQRPGLVGAHMINVRLSPNTCTYLVADYAMALYIRRPFVYHSAFDRSQLGEMIRAAEGDPAKVNALLRDAGITHVWIGWSELDRLHATYGYDPDVTRDTLHALIATGWRQLEHVPDVASLYALPAEPPQ